MARTPRRGSARIFGWIPPTVRKRVYSALANKRVMAVTALVLYTLVVCRFQQSKDLKLYADMLEGYKAEQVALAEEARYQDPYEAQLDAEAEMLAKVLYGVRDNNTDDKRTYCWCVFNRVENVAFPDTLEDVIAQPEQWIRYDETNPVIEDLFQIARAELDTWHSSTRRPVSSEFVFVNWSSDDICLRDNFYEGSGTHYWRITQ